MKVTCFALAAALLLAIGCNQPNTGSGTMPDPPTEGANTDRTEKTAPVAETQTVLLEQYKKDKDGSYFTAKFKVCKTGTTPPRGFFQADNYYCYDEGSKTIVRTQGGCTGNLLHGKFAQYYASGDLMGERYYYYGLLDSVEIEYNKAHEIILERMWNMGKEVK